MVHVLSLVVSFQQVPKNAFIKTVLKQVHVSRLVQAVRFVKKLKPNINKDELYFELGMPSRNEGNEYYFHGNAGENTQVKATILNGVVEILECEI